MIIHKVLLFLAVVAFVAPDDASAEDDSNLSSDDKALYNILVQTGGAAGEVPVTIQLPDSPVPPKDFWGKLLDDPCNEWSYEYTKLVPGGRVRHEHAVVRYPGTKHEVLDVAGQYFQMDQKGDSSFILDYYRQGRNKTLWDVNVNCKTSEWGVMTCSPCLYEDYVVHGIQSPSCREAGSAPPTIVGNTTLEALVGVEGLQRFEFPEKFNIAPLLDFYGGKPGKDKRKQQGATVLPPEPEDPEQRPLPDAPKSAWVYDLRYNNLPNAIRFEHAVWRFRGTRRAFLDIRGVVYWRSHVGDFRVTYVKDDTGLHTKVDSAQCDITRGFWRCAYPKNIPPPSCGAGIPEGLLASLLG